MPRQTPLTPEQDLFLDEYLIDPNGTRAYLAAYPGSTYQTARSEASKLLAKPNIKREIRARRDARQRRTRVRADAVIREAARIAFSDPLFLFGRDGFTPLPIRDVPLETRRAIAGVKVRRERVEKRPEGTITADCPECGHSHDVKAEVCVEYEVIEYKLWPKTKGLDKLFAHLGLAEEITPLDALLAALPADLATQVRQALAGGHGDGNRGGATGGPG